MSMNNLKGFVFYVDILGFTALTQDKIQLTEDDFNVWQVSKHFRTLGNQEFAANILILFRKILTDCQNKYPTVNFTQLSDCAFVWSENMKDVILSCHSIMWNCLQNGILCRGGIAYGNIIEDYDSKLGQMLLGNAVSKAVKLEQAGAKGCRVLMDQEVPISLNKYDSSFYKKIHRLFQPFENPLDYQVYDEFKWYYSYSLKDLNTTKGIIQATIERLCLAAKLQFHPRFNWNVQTPNGSIHVKSSMRFTSANEQNVLKIDHPFQWIDLVDLKIRTETNYKRIAKKIQDETSSYTIDKEGLIKFPVPADL